MDAGERHALLVGCTEYPHLLEEHGETFYEQSVRLLGPANDVHLFHELLVDKFEFPPDTITTLVGWDEGDPSSRPTCANIEKAFQNLARTVGQDDYVVILMAGHGSHQPAGAGSADAGRRELDGRDEIFLPADVKGWLSEQATVENAIVDDEIGEWLAAIREKGALVWITFDVCPRGNDDAGRARKVGSRPLSRTPRCCVCRRSRLLPVTSAREAAGRRATSRTSSTFARPAETGTLAGALLHTATYVLTLLFFYVCAALLLREGRPEPDSAT